MAKQRRSAGATHRLSFCEPVCVECGGMGKLASRAQAAPQSNPDASEMVFVCVCGAWVSCHPGTGVAAGRPASAQTRYLRHKAHEAFDALWLGDRKKGVATGYARQRAYRWLARELGRAPDETGIGWMGAEECRRVIELCEARKGGTERAA